MSIAPRPCSYPGCPRLTRGRWCEEHQATASQRDIEYRGSASDRGYGDAKWKALRDFFADSHEHCISCGRWLPRNKRIVDHVIPHRNDERLRLDPSNLQLLCPSCHTRKTKREGPGLRAARGGGW